MFAKKTIFTLCLMFCLLFGCSEDNSSKTTEWKFAIEEVEGSVQHIYAEKFKDLIAKKSQGKIDVTIYPYGTIGTSDQILELVHSNTVQFAMSSPGHLGKTIKEVQLFSLHFLFSNNEEVNKNVLRSGKTINVRFKKLYRERGFHLLSIYPEGWQVWTSSRAIKKPQDFSGFKMRVMTSPLLIETYETYGASAITLPYSEVYSGLQLGMIDGQVNPVFAIQEMSFYEVNDYLIFPKAAVFVASAIANPNFFEKLPRQQQQWINEAISELYDYIFEEQEKLNAARLKEIKEKKPEVNIIRLTQKQRQAFREYSLKLREKYVEMAGKKGQEILQQFLEEIESEENKVQEN